MADNKNEMNVQSYDSIEKFYDSIDEKGSIGLLAYGATGLLLWRKKKEEIKKRREEDKNAK